MENTKSVIKEDSTEKDLVTIKFNAHVTPKVKWNNKEKKFESFTNSIDFRHEYAKLLDEEGDSPEETKKLKRMHTRLWSLREAMNYIYGDFNDKSKVQFYFKGETVTLPKDEADYYMAQTCGGMLKTYRDKQWRVEPYKRNIDEKQGYYEANQMSRFEREHVVVPVAEVVKNG